MVFFVPPKKSTKSKKTSVDIALECLLIGKRLGLSFEEINELRLRDLVLMADITIGETATEATQEDIDRLLR